MVTPPHSPLNNLLMIPLHSLGILLGSWNIFYKKVRKVKPKINTPKMLALNSDCLENFATAVVKFKLEPRSWPTVVQWCCITMDSLGNNFTIHFCFPSKFD